MSETLLKKAEADLRVAKIMLSSADDFDVQVAAYHAQQAVAKCIKVALEASGGSYKRIHHIDSLLDELPKGSLFSLQSV